MAVRGPAGWGDGQPSPMHLRTVLEDGGWKLGLEGAHQPCAAQGPRMVRTWVRKRSQPTAPFQGPEAALTTSSHQRAVLANELQRAACGRWDGVASPSKSTSLVPPGGIAVLWAPTSHLLTPTPSLPGGPGERAEAPQRKPLLLLGGGFLLLPLLLILLLLLLGGSWEETGRQESRREH